MPTSLGWKLADLNSVPKNGIRVMTTFACGGGSSMGYKLAGCEVVAANDIDPEMEWHYRTNLHPPLFYRCPISDLLTKPIADHLYGIDILDGSPPCSTFSTVGNREDDWGKEKKFREGQAVQVLSDLFFDWLALVERVKPKVAIAENVKGMILGKAQGYCKLVLQRLRQIGYRPQLFLLNSADCGVPQSRERVFFCAVRNDINAMPLRLSPRSRHISASEALRDIESHTRQELEAAALTEHARYWWNKTKPGDHFGDTKKRNGIKRTEFSTYRINGSKPCNTIAATRSLMHWIEPRYLTFREAKRLGSFPDDYVARSEQIGYYMVGMSVPPRMTQRVAEAVLQQWLS